MEKKVFQYNQKHQLFNQGETLFLAVSGGPDSLALLYFFASIQASWDLTLYTLTVDHQLRGQASLNDALFVKETSERLGIPCEVGQLNVKAYQDNKQIGTQAAARELRYQFFQKKMNAEPNAKLVFGHHQDDLVESMVMQFSRGVHPKGIPVRREFGEHQIIRPFLCLTKDDLWQYITEHKLEPRIDTSNEDDSYTRNRVRKHIVPLLKKENPSLQKSLSELQEQFVEEEEYLVRLATEKLHEIATFNKNKVEFSIKAFQAMGLPLQRRAFHLILNYLNHVYFFEKDYFKTFQDWLQSQQSNSQYEITEHLTFIKSYNQCQIRNDRLLHSSYNEQISLNESVTLPNGWVVRMTEVEHVKDHVGQHQFFCDNSHIKFPITIRSRKNGDRIKPLGMQGRKKIKDIFIDQKIPKYLRDEWPIVVNSDGEIIWIPYICKSHLAKDSGNNLIQISIDKSD